jgi:uncharacterized protein (TIGR04255 family)
MIAPKHLNKAPIVEAVIDLAVNPPAGFDVKRLFELKNKMADSYSKMTEVHRNTLQISPPQLAPSPSDEIIGYLFTSNDGFYVAQVRSDEFIFSRLKPYSSWEDFSAEARRIWGYYIETVKPQFVKRVALRYINQIRLPLPVNFEDYFSNPPRVPEGLPTVVSNFFNQIIIEDIQNRASTMVVQFTQPLTDTAFLNAILDIASYRQGDFEVDSDEIWAILEVLRNAKNRAFFSSITEQALKLFE